MPWSTTESSTVLGVDLVFTTTAEPAPGVGHRVGDQVGDRGHQLLPVAEHLEAVSRRR